MSLLYVDDSTNIFDDPKVTKKNELSAKYNDYINDYIETHYKGEDSEAVYALFNAEQVKLLQNYYKSFSIDMYRELNGTVELQIQKKNENVKKKIAKIGEMMGTKIKLEDWAYDGMVDSGKNAGVRCDLCPRPIRYAHHAINKKTGECLQFGCNCASEFFNMDKATLMSMKTIQAKTLRDIKIIACVVEMGEAEKYYDYMCGYTGCIYLKNGAQGIRDLMTFIVKWDKNGNLVGDEELDEYPVKFGDNTVAKKSLLWIKDNIISCLNADLSDNIYDALGSRAIVRIDMKNMDKVQENNYRYITSALMFLQENLPIPLSLCKKINSIVQKVTKQHHPDYLKYVQELLMQRNLAKSSLLRKAFSDFIINYLASSIGTEKRDPEMAAWGIRGQGTFYKTVLLWESALSKLEVIKEIEKMIKDGLISKTVFERYCRLPGDAQNYVGKSFDCYYSSINPFINDCIGLFMVNKPVVRVEDNYKKYYSKYMLKGKDKTVYIDVDKTLYDKDDLDVNSLPSGYLYADSIPYYLNYCYIAYQNAYKRILSSNISFAKNFIKGVNWCDTDEHLLKYLCSLDLDLDRYATGIIHKSYTWFNDYYYSKNATSFLSALDDFKVYPELEEYVTKKYKKSLKGFKASCKELTLKLEELTKEILSIKALKYKKSEILDDFDEMLKKTKKSYTDCYTDFCNLLIAKPGSKELKNIINKYNLLDMTMYSDMSKYTDMLTDIQNMYIEMRSKEAEKEVYKELGLDNLFAVLYTLISLNDYNKFMEFCFIDWCYRNDKDAVIEKFLSKTGYYTKMSYSSSLDTIVEVVKKKNAFDDVLSSCDEKYGEYFKSVFERFEELYNNINGSLRYKSYLELLDINLKGVDKKLKGIKNIREYKDLLETEFDVHPFSCNRYSIRFKDFLSEIQIYKGFAGLLDEISDKVSAIYDEVISEAEKAEEEKKKKEPFVTNINRFSNEHIAFLKVDVDAERQKSVSGYKFKKSDTDASIRRKVAIKTVEMVSSESELRSFLNELKDADLSKFSDGTSEFVDRANKALAENNVEDIKKMNSVFRVELYNRNLIYTHLDITLKVLTALVNSDLYSLSVEELKEIEDIVRYYYLFKSGIDRISEILGSHNIDLGFDYSEEVKNIPEPNYINLKDFYKGIADEPDETGLSGVQKAEVLYKHPDYNNWSTFHRSLIKGIALYKRCSPKQLPYVTELYKSVILGEKNDTVSDNDMIDADNLKEFTGGNCLPFAEAKEMVLLAEQIKKHSDFSTLQGFLQDIVNTIYTNGKNGVARCSNSQKKYILKAKTELKIQ